MRTHQDELAEFPLFSDASRSQLEIVRRALTKVDVAAGCVLVEEGARGDQFMIISDGEAAVSRGGLAIATLERGDLVGEMALLEGDGIGRRNATVTVRSDATIYVGTPAEFRQILQAAPSVAHKVRQTAAVRGLSRVA